MQPPHSLQDGQRTPAVVPFTHTTAFLFRSSQKTPVLLSAESVSPSFAAVLPARIEAPTVIRLAAWPSSRLVCWKGSSSAEVAHSAPLQRFGSVEQSVEDSLHEPPAAGKPSCQYGKTKLVSVVPASQSCPRACRSHHKNLRCNPEHAEECDRSATTFSFGYGASTAPEKSIPSPSTSLACCPPGMAAELASQATSLQAPRGERSSSVARATARTELGSALSSLIALVGKKSKPCQVTTPNCEEVQWGIRSSETTHQELQLFKPPPCSPCTMELRCLEQDNAFRRQGEDATRNVERCIEIENAIHSNAESGEPARPGASMTIGKRRRMRMRDRGALNCSDATPVRSSALQTTSPRFCDDVLEGAPHQHGAVCHPHALAIPDHCPKMTEHLREACVCGSTAKRRDDAPLGGVPESAHSPPSAPRPWCTTPSTIRDSSPCKQQRRTAWRFIPAPRFSLSPGSTADATASLESPAACSLRDGSRRSQPQPQHTHREATPSQRPMEIEEQHPKPSPRAQTAGACACQAYQACSDRRISGRVKSASPSSVFGQLTALASRPASAVPPLGSTPLSSLPPSWKLDVALREHEDHTRLIAREETAGRERIEVDAAVQLHHLACEERACFRILEVAEYSGRLARFFTSSDSGGAEQRASKARIRQHLDTAVAVLRVPPTTSPEHAHWSVLSVASLLPLNSQEAISIPPLLDDCEDALLACGGDGGVAVSVSSFAVSGITSHVRPSSSVSVTRESSRAVAEDNAFCAAGPHRSSSIASSGSVHAATDWKTVAEASCSEDDRGCRKVAAPAAAVSQEQQCDGNDVGTRLALDSALPANDALEFVPFFPDSPEQIRTLSSGCARILPRRSPSPQPTAPPATSLNAASLYTRLRSIQDDEEDGRYLIVGTCPPPRIFQRWANRFVEQEQQPSPLAMHDGAFHAPSDGHGGGSAPILETDDSISLMQRRSSPAVAMASLMRASTDNSGAVRCPREASQRAAATSRASLDGTDRSTSCQRLYSERNRAWVMEAFLDDCQGIATSSPDLAAGGAVAVSRMSERLGEDVHHGTIRYSPDPLLVDREKRLPATASLQGASRCFFQNHASLEEAAASEASTSPSPSPQRDSAAFTTTAISGTAVEESAKKNHSRTTEAAAAAGQHRSSSSTAGPLAFPTVETYVAPLGSERDEWQTMMDSFIDGYLRLMTEELV